MQSSVRASRTKGSPVPRDLDLTTLSSVEAEHNKTTELHNLNDSIMKDPETGQNRVNPLYRKHQVAKLADHFFKK